MKGTFISPVIAIVNADSKGNLNFQKEEIEKIFVALQKLEARNFFRLVHLSDPKTEELSALFINNSRIQIFFYSGHAGDNLLELPDGGGYSKGLKGFFERQGDLSLLFLNGCNTEQQAKLYLGKEKGARVVIATFARVADSDAKNFAVAFFNSIVAERSIREAFEDATAELASNKANKKFIFHDNQIVVCRGENMDDVADDAVKPIDFPWRLYVREGFEPHLDWKLSPQTAVMEKLRQGSAKYLTYLRQGRFKYVQIENALLAEMENRGNTLTERTLKESLFDTRVIMSRPDNPSEEIPLEECVKELWNDAENKHLLLLGEGGAGKTVAVLRLWEEYVRQPSLERPVPIFIALNEINRISDPFAQKNFLKDYISRNYLGLSYEALSQEDRKALELNLDQPLQANPFIPGILLLLDSLNEVTNSEGLKNLLIGLDDLLKKSSGIQVVLTSRYDCRSSYTFTGRFHLVALQLLQENRIIKYLKDKDISADVLNAEKRKELLGNPMMLTLFAASSELFDRYASDTKEYEFRQNIGSAGEIMWNFLEAQLAKFKRDDDIQLNGVQFKMSLTEI